MCATEEKMRRNKIIYAVLFLSLCAFCFLGTPQRAQAAQDGEMIESLSVSVGKKGFCPGKGKTLTIRTYVNAMSQPVDIRLRIYEEDSYIFQKKFKNSRGGYLSYGWKGKAGKKNEAGLSPKNFVTDGTYTVEICVLQSGTETALSVRTCEFNVSSQASGGAGIPILTGNAKVDYMAEKIIKSAKIKSSLSDKEKVRLIYHWMTVNQKHVHYYNGGNFKTYYKLPSSQQKIDAYRKKTDKLCKKGKLVYNHDSGMLLTAWCMERRIGVCTDHAAIFKVLCNHVGIEAGICSGYYLNRNGTKPPHSWNYAVIDGITYYYDVDVEIQNFGKGQGDYYWFQKTKPEADRTHQFVSIR